MCRQQRRCFLPPAEISRRFRFPTVNGEADGSSISLGSAREARAHRPEEFPEDHRARRRRRPAPTRPRRRAPPSRSRSIPARDALLTNFGSATLQDRYLLAGETTQDLFARVARAYADDGAHAQRLYDYMSQLWFMPATPILSNGGTARGLPISCFLNSVEDNLDGIVSTWTENVWLASNGGGIGTYWGGVRSIGEKVKGCGQTSGIIPFVRVMDSLTLAISQGSLRRGSAAVYLDVIHPEIEEFLEIRKPSGDFNRKSLNLHHGISITDEFMQAVRDDLPFALRSPKDGKELRTLSRAPAVAEDPRDAPADRRALPALQRHGEQPARAASARARPQGAPVEPVQRNPAAHRRRPSGPRAHRGVLPVVGQLRDLGQWSEEPRFIEDVLRMLDNVLQDFIDHAPASMDTAKYSAMRERSVGLGAMGFHSWLQNNGIPFESALARAANLRMFKHLRREADAASQVLAEERGACPDAAERGVMERFSHKLAIAPDRQHLGDLRRHQRLHRADPGQHLHAQDAVGLVRVRNPALEKVLDEKG